MRVYHWTHVRLLHSIRKTGLDPARAKGKRPLVWLCEDTLVESRAREVAKKHGWDVRDMVLLSVEIEGLPIWPYFQSGVRVSRQLIPAYRIAVCDKSRLNVILSLSELEV